MTTTGTWIKNGLGTEFDFGLVGCGIRDKKAKVNIVAFPQDGRIAGISCRVDVRPGCTRATAATATLTDGKGGKKKNDEGSKQERLVDINVPSAKRGKILP